MEDGGAVKDLMGGDACIMTLALSDYEMRLFYDVMSRGIVLVYILPILGWYVRYMRSVQVRGVLLRWANPRVTHHTHNACLQVSQKVRQILGSLLSRVKQGGELHQFLICRVNNTAVLQLSL